MEEEQKAEDNTEVLNEVAEQVDTSESQDSQEDIDKAKKYGYKSPEEYEGNPKYQISAKDYIQRIEKGGIIKDLQNEVKASRNEAKELKEAFEKMEKLTQVQINSAKVRMLEEIKAKQIKAIDNDGATPQEAFDAYERDKAKVEEQHTPKQEERQQYRDPPEIERFYQENSWYHNDVVMQGAANSLHTDIKMRSPTMPLAQQLDEVKKRIVEEFPHKFENPKRRSQSIEGGNSIGSGGGNVHKKVTFQSLGYTAKDIADVREMIRGGTWKDEADFFKTAGKLKK